MATNVTNNSIDFFNNILNRKIKSYNDAFNRIDYYNTIIIPYKASLKKPKYLEPISIDENPEIVGLKKQINSYNIIIYLLSIKISSYTKSYSIDFNKEDLNIALGYISRAKKQEEIRLYYAEKRLYNKIEKIKAVKAKKPKKYGDILSKLELEKENGNPEMNNCKMKISHYDKALIVLNDELEKYKKEN